MTNKKKSKSNNNNKTKEFKIVKIINSETIIINAGTNNGIKVNDVFEILGEGTKIIDPDTKENLGFIDNVKETVSVLEVFPKMCECAHISEHSSLLNLANSLNGYKYKKILNIDKNDMSTEDNFDKTLRIGDTAKLITSIENIKSTKN